MKLPMSEITLKLSLEQQKVEAERLIQKLEQLCPDIAVMYNCDFYYTKIGEMVILEKSNIIVLNHIF
jgi:hypothetical protein